ncbi:hypothetical protein AL073_14925 [Loktanella sp. 1ANDIMAR09]|nr:hypothetical protein AL073_14925 [Loktanella sp. 1ANDIMAR09]
MNTMSNRIESDDALPLVEVLTNSAGTVIIGYRLGGIYAGPHVVVAGHDPIADMTYSRLISLPTIGWMRGSLTLLLMNAMERCGLLDDTVNALDPRLDEIHFLPNNLDPAFHAEAAVSGYRSTLRLCARLGMISGRGVSLDTPKKPNEVK